MNATSRKDDAYSQYLIAAKLILTMNAKDYINVQHVLLSIMQFSLNCMHSTYKRRHDYTSSLVNNCKNASYTTSDCYDCGRGWICKIEATAILFYFCGCSIVSNHWLYSRDQDRTACHAHTIQYLKVEFLWMHHVHMLHYCNIDLQWLFCIM